MSDSGSDSEAWSPIQARKTKKVARVFDDTDDEDVAAEALAESTSEEEDNNNANESSEVIVGCSDDEGEAEAEADSDSFRTAGDGTSVAGSSFRSVRRSDESEHSVASQDTLEGTSDEHAELSNSSHESLPDIPDVQPENSNRSQEKVREKSDKRKDQPPTFMVPPTTASTARSKGTPSDFVDVEDTLVADLNNITLKGASQFSFKKKPDDKNTKEHRAIGATCGGFFDDEEEEEDEEEISANFDFDNLQDSGNGDSDIQVVHDDNQQKPKQTTGKPAMIDLTNSDTDDLSILAQQLSLGKDAPKKDAPRRMIFLDEAPPPEKKTYSYDPTNVKHQEFYGDVQRTIAQIAHTIENMPTPEDADDEVVLPKGLVPLFDHQLYGLRWLSWREREFPGGGILADEMGLGKTIMVIALIMKSKMDGINAAGSNEENWIDTEEVGRCIPSKTTLVVCPVGCLHQWNDEISSKGKGLRVNLFHGPKRTTSAAQLAQYDVVLTTYHTIIAEIPKDDTRGRSPLLRIYWKRIVLDEAHNIRNPKTAGAVAICKLSARHRWAVTGTPVHNRPEDFYSMAKFLRMKPFDDSKTWDFWIGLKAVRRATDAQQRLHLLGKALILRRTKEEVQSAGGNVKKIPPKTIEIIEVELSEAERRVNDYLVQYSKNMFKQFLEDKDQRTRELNGAAMTYTAERKKKQQAQAPPDDIKFSHLFALLIRMRQCAVLPYLIETMLEEEEIDEDVSFDELRDDHIISKINPVFDRLYVSSKFKRILEDVETLRAEAKAEGRPMDKVIIVSSWTTTLDILNQHLTSKRFSCIFITGREKTTDRSDNMKKFNKYPEKYHICLLSLMAGGVGLNLTGGNHVFFVEPHWNPQLELQAQDRVHRFGQTKNVTIKRYIAKETVEDRIREMQNTKIDLADGVLNSTKMTKGGGLTIAHLRTLFQ